MSHNLGEILRCSVVRMLLPMSEAICASVDDAVKMRCPIRCGGNNRLRFVRRIGWFEAKELGEQCQANRVCLCWAHAVLNRERADAAEGVNRKNLLRLGVTLKMRVAVVRHDTA